MDIIKLTSKISNSLSVLNIFGWNHFKADLSHSETELIIKEVENTVYGKRGIYEYEKNITSERKRLFIRSFAQYQAKRKLYKSKNVLFALEIFFGLLIFPFIFFIILKQMLRFKEKNRDKNKSSVNTAVLCGGYYFKKIINDVYDNENVIFIESIKLELTRNNFLFFLKCIKDYPVSLLYPGFLFSVFKWLTMYENIINYYNPKNILNFFEGSFASSTITAYLRESKIMHINYMHGERFTTPLLSFCEFDKFHVYGEYWIDFFKKLRCRSDFIVSGNSFHRELYIKLRQSQNNNKRLLILHNQLLSPQSKEIYLLKNILNAVNNDWKIRIRLHPNEIEYGKEFYEYLNKIFVEKHLMIDEYQELSIDNSLRDAKIVVGLYTAALFESWIAGRKVIFIRKNEDLKERFERSKNILFPGELTSENDLKLFMETPFIINDSEDEMLNYLTKMKNPTVLQHSSSFKNIL